MTHRRALNALSRLPGFKRSPSGLEWALWKRLPAILLLGVALALGERRPVAATGSPVAHLRGGKDA